MLNMELQSYCCAHDLNVKILLSLVLIGFHFFQNGFGSSEVVELDFNLVKDGSKFNLFETAVLSTQR